MREEERTYRAFSVGDGLAGFRVKVETTDLFIRAGRDLSKEALELTAKARKIIADHGRARPEFLTTFAPLEKPDGVHPLLAAMYRAAELCGVGPMAAVAGAVAQHVAEGLKPYSETVYVENGGDLFLMGNSPATVGIYAGKSPFSNRLALEFSPDELPLSVCTSSATVGPSISFGNADAATIAAESGALADAAASGLGNRLKTGDDLEPALAWALSVPGVRGALGIIGGHLGCQGSLKLVRIQPNEG